MARELRASRPVMAGGRPWRIASRNSAICNPWNAGKPGRPRSAPAQAARSEAPGSNVQTSLIPWVPSGISWMLAVAPLCVDRHSIAECGIDGRECLDAAERSVFEDDRGAGGVLDIDIRTMPQRGDAAIDLARRTHEPLQQIDGVDCLVHHDATPLGGPFSAPGIGREIRLWSPKQRLRGTKGELAHQSVVDGTADALGGRPETRGSTPKGSRIVAASSVGFFQPTASGFRRAHSPASAGERLFVRG